MEEATDLRELAMRRVRGGVETDADELIKMAEVDRSGVGLGATVGHVERRVDLVEGVASVVHLIVDVVNVDAEVLDTSGNSVRREHVDARLAVFENLGREVVLGVDAEEAGDVLKRYVALDGAEDTTGFTIGGVSGNDSLLFDFPIDADAKDESKEGMARATCTHVAGVVTVNHNNHSVGELDDLVLGSIKVDTNSVIAVDSLAWVHDGTMKMGGEIADRAMKTGKGGFSGCLNVATETGAGEAHVGSCPDENMKELSHDAAVGAAVLLLEEGQLFLGSGELFGEVAFKLGVRAKGRVCWIEALCRLWWEEFVLDGPLDVVRLMI